MAEDTLRQLDEIWPAPEAKRPWPTPGDLTYKERNPFMDTRTLGRGLDVSVIGLGCGG